MDAVLTVEYVKAYFNGSDPVRVRAWRERCPDLEGAVTAGGNATCEIPEVVGALDGNGSARTWFFSKEGNFTAGQVG